MSKQSEAKTAQGYRTEQRNCSNCVHLKSEKKLPEWMAARNTAARGAGRPEFPIEVYGIERNLRCGIGGFAIKKTATCERWSPASA